MLLRRLGGLSLVLGVAAAPILTMAESETYRQGERLFRDQCSGCHSLEPGIHRAGPSLDGLMNRPAGSLDDFPYSQAMHDATHRWTPETLDRFLADPETLVPGTAMVFWGLDEASREQVIHYLETATLPDDSAE
ncbi:c-type cytochrome [Aidingimonas lacisalsi]|uniref:c-type cytochrome n=1 Tax=Aidingimonas lacisalsi TaxID=2604086 RepID=UPI0011D1EF50|nr:c-type cytochrome [Aidingimonas lacisalsi]